MRLPPRLDGGVVKLMKSTRYYVVPRVDGRDMEPPRLCEGWAELKSLMLGGHVLNSWKSFSTRDLAERYARTGAYCPVAGARRPFPALRGTADYVG